MRFSVLLLLLTSILIDAKQFSYAEVHRMPRSVEKDYYIWRLLRESRTTKEEAKKIIYEAKFVSSKIKKAYKRKVGRKSPPAKGWYIVHVSPKIKEKRKKRRAKVKAIMKSKKPFSEWLKLENSEKIYVFNHIGKRGRKLLDHAIPKKLWLKLCLYSKFDDCIRKIEKENLKNIKQAYVYPPPSKNGLDSDALAILALTAIRENNKLLAMQYFELASRKASDRESLDMILFWEYLLAKKKSYLRTLIKSYDLNIYTLLARDFLHKKYPNYPTPNLPKKRLLDPEKISDPFYWKALKKKIFSKRSKLGKLADQYFSRESVGFYTYIKSKQSRYKEHYFPMPYQDILSKLPKSRQAILYAIARQESRFIPASISSSYALGMMQIMPFLIDHLSKQRKEKIDYDDMFDPKTALIYANEHMNYLTKWLQHPLFIAYAYNAGIGFTRGILRNKSFFRNAKGYEPYLSIERLPNAQAKRYGKHVLVNYVIYMNKLGVSLRTSDLLSVLHIPKKTDKFRK